MFIWLAVKGEAVSLSRIFERGQKAQFKVESTLQTESRHQGISTWFPDSVEYRYQFSTEVETLKPQGSAKVRYKRPILTKVFAEQFDHPERTNVEKVADDILLDISAANEILDAADVKPSLKVVSNWHTGRDSVTLKADAEDVLKNLYSLALFTGSLESSIDFNPRLPFEKVRPGDTWKRTASYAPQKLKHGGDVAVQRLDYTYRYVGRMQSEGKLVDRVTASLHLDSDVASYLNAKGNSDGEASRLGSLPMELTASMDFDLDTKTHQTLRATANSKGNFKVFTIDSPSEPYYEEKITGHTELIPVAR